METKEIDINFLKKKVIDKMIDDMKRFNDGQTIEHLACAMYAISNGYLKMFSYLSSISENKSIITKFCDKFDDTP